MKKVLATVLALGMTTLLFTACNQPAETTTGEIPTVTTTGDSNVSTTETTTAQATTTGKQKIEFADEDMIDNVAYNYYCKILRAEGDILLDERGEPRYDENGDVLRGKGEIIGLAVSGWKNNEATENVKFDSEYSFVDNVGSPYTLPIIQVGVGQGVVTFQAKLESVEIPAGVTKIANKAFPGCTQLKSVELPEGLTSIGDMAFWNCTSLESVEIPSTVTSIGKYAFSDCVNLKSVTIPGRFESQAANIFDGCPNVVITYTN